MKKLHALIKPVNSPTPFSLQTRGGKRFQSIESAVQKVVKKVTADMLISSAMLIFPASLPSPAFIF
jgi:hypothetical protein